MGQKSHWRSLLHPPLAIPVFLGKWNRRGEAKRFLCPATAMAHPGQRRRWGRGSLSSGIGNACDFLSQSAAVKAPQLCPRKRSAVHVPMQRIAFAIAARCVCPCSALRFLSYRGSGHQAAHSVPVPMLRHHSSVRAVMNWAPDFGGAWHGAKDFQQSYRKIRQKAVLWQKKWARWLDLSQNLDKFAMIRTKKQKHEGKTFPRCAAQRSVSQATRHIPQTTKASGLEEVQQGREIPSE